MKTFTLGPWGNVRFDDHGRFTIQTQEGGHIEENNYISLSEMQANATLIAAAPEMYEALTLLLVECDEYLCCHDDANMQIRVSESHAALAKARGNRGE